MLLTKQHACGGFKTSANSMPVLDGQELKVIGPKVDKGVKLSFPCNARGNLRTAKTTSNCNQTPLLNK